MQPIATISKQTWTPAAARKALEQYERTVRAMARRLRPLAAMGQALDEEDLCAEGRIAVLEALGSYRGYGIEEHTWVRTRVRQRMIDAIRRLDVRSRDEMRLAARHAAGELANDDEVERGRAINARRLISLDSLTDDTGVAGSRLRDSVAPPADEVASSRDRGRRLATALADLPPRQRQAIELGIFSGLALREIGDKMGISPARVCQLQKRAVEHLSRAVADAAEAA
jgi:RNA polymerase sigma factor (sigma-70 family)